jgi:hypothetical protein
MLPENIHGTYSCHLHPSETNCFLQKLLLPVPLKLVAMYIGQIAKGGIK